MSDYPQVVVKKGGFFSAIVRGVFGLLVACVVCGSAVTIAGMYFLDRNAEQFLNMAERVVTEWPAWEEFQKVLPPVLADATRDRRAPEYRDQLDVQVELARGRDGHSPRAVISVGNRGNEVVSLLAVHVVGRDADGIPVTDFVAYPVTPLACGEGCRNGDVAAGPLFADSEPRVHLKRIYDEDVAQLTAEVVDIRLWQPLEQTAEPANPTPLTGPPGPSTYEVPEEPPTPES